MLNYFPKYFSKTAIGLYILLIFTTQLIFIGRGLPILPILFGIFQVVGFFYFTYYLSVKWINKTPENLKKNLFRYSFIIRSFYVLASYYFYIYMTDQPFAFAAADSIGYHNEATYYANLLKSGMLWEHLQGLHAISDTGYSVYLSVIYFITGNNILIVRILKAFLSAYTAVFIYRIAYRNFGESVGRITGIMAMLLPNFIYYTGIHLKETEMLFLTMAFTDRADYVLKANKISLKNLLITLSMGFGLFFFRTVLAVPALFSFLSGILIAKSRYNSLQKRITIVIIFVVFAALVTGSTLVNEISQYWGGRTTNQELGMASRHIDIGSKFVKYARTSIFAPVILFAPFPTLVNIHTQQNIMLINGAYYTRNIYAFFILIALYFIYKERSYRKHFFILSFMLTYLAVLAASTFALSERFHLPALPFLIIFSSYGITKLNKLNSRFYVPYLVLIFIIIIAWNWIKLSSRGL